MRKLALLAAPLLLAAACASQGATGAPAGGGGAEGQRSAVGLSAPGAPDVAKSVTQSAPGPNGISTALINVDRNLILTAKIDMRSKDPWATSDLAQRIASNLGGDVLSSSQTGNADNRSASLTIRVPSSRFAEALEQLKKLEGEVVASGVSAQDVTDQFVDLQARLAAKHSEEQRYLNILNTKANTVDEILKIDAALTNVRTQIEQLTGQINSIKQRTEFSTISMSISMPSVLPGDTTGRAWDPVKTFVRALAALGAFLQVVADFAIWLLVFGWIPILATAALIIVMRTRRTATPPAPAA